MSRSGLDRMREASRLEGIGAPALAELDPDTVSLEELSVLLGP